MFTNTNFEEKTGTRVFLLDKSLCFRVHQYKFREKSVTPSPYPNPEKNVYGFCYWTSHFFAGFTNTNSEENFALHYTLLVSFVRLLVHHTVCIVSLLSKLLHERMNDSDFMTFSLFSVS